MEAFDVEIITHTLTFKTPATTSRGKYYTHKVWYLLFRSTSNPQHIGIGEVAPLPDLSKEYSLSFEKQLKSFTQKVTYLQSIDIPSLANYPSIRFGLETAWKHFTSTKPWMLWDNDFSQGKKGILINGLIWMGNIECMKQQIEKKLQEGFKCLKLKIGALDFKQELKLLSAIRESFSSNDLQIRVDANGAFDPHDAEKKLNMLAPYSIHSIEQPIAAGNHLQMANLTQKSPIPIALDEELIGIHANHEKETLLRTIAPQYIILKPTLHGGFSGCEEWINAAEKLQIPFWITSALESNIGLNAIAQWCSEFHDTANTPQGLGTGMLYTNNIDLPLTIKEQHLWLSLDNHLPRVDLLLKYALSKS